MEWKFLLNYARKLYRIVYIRSEVYTNTFDRRCFKRKVKCSYYFKAFQFDVLYYCLNEIHWLIKEEAKIIVGADLVAFICSGEHLRYYHAGKVDITFPNRILWIEIIRLLLISFEWITTPWEPLVVNWMYVHMEICGQMCAKKKPLGGGSTCVSKWKILNG